MEEHRMWEGESDLLELHKETSSICTVLRFVNT